MQSGDQNLRDVLSDNLISDHSETGIVITILLPASNLPCPEWFALPTKIALASRGQQLLRRANRRNEVRHRLTERKSRDPFPWWEKSFPKWNSSEG